MANWHMKSSGWSAPRVAVLLLSIFFLCINLISPLPVQARAKSALNSRDNDYVSALATADRFLSVWRAEDRENGLVMVTNAAKQGKSEDQLGDFFSPGDGSAFEIGQGKKLKVGRYSFPVTLLEVTSGRRVHPRLWQMVVVRSGKDDWAVDTLP